MKSFLLTLLLAGGITCQASAASLVHESTITWRDSDERFGGLSGLEVLDGGSRVVAIGDRGIWVTGELIRSDGKLTSAQKTGLGPLLSDKGKPLKGYAVDAEGLTRDSRGRYYVSFEAFHRIRRYDQLDGPAKPIPNYSEFETLGWNAGLEAIAMDRNDVLYAIREETRTEEPVIPIYRFRNGKWDQDLKIRRGEGFLVTDAEFGPDGKLYVLERKFKKLGGFATRVRRFTMEPKGIGNEEILLTTKFGDMDNMEGLAVWRDSLGQIRVDLISDDNFFFLQRTQIAEFIVRED